MLLLEVIKVMIVWELVLLRFMLVRFNLKGRKIIIIQCYVLINVVEEQEKDEFYVVLQLMIDCVFCRDIKVVMGDMNVKVGEDNINKEFIMGKYGIGNINENGEFFIDFCNFNDLVIGGIIFLYKKIYKIIWFFLDGKIEN